jgi:tight adherence protein B
MQTTLIYLAVFIAVLVLADTLQRSMRNSLERKRFINYRLSLIEHDADRKVVYRQMLKERGIESGDQQLTLKALRRYVAQSGIRFEGIRSLIYFTALILAFFALWSFLGLSTLPSLLAAIPSAMLVVALYVSQMRRRRIRRFLAQFPDALEVIVRSLGAGHPLPVAIALVGREMADPIGSEFGIMTDELTYGTDVDTATRNMGTRVGAEELNLLAISLTVQRGAGGNLAEILTNLADMVRRRVMMKAKIKAISAEGRMTSWFMLFFPFVLYGIISLLNPTYFAPIWETGNGPMFLAAGGAMMVIGMLILRKIVNFDY